jgi:hypothetical protein
VLYFSHPFTGVRMISMLMLLVLAAPFNYDRNGITFELDRPSDWVVDTCEAQDGLVALSQRDGLASMSVNIFEDLMWSDALNVFKENTGEFLDMGYTLSGKSRLTKSELKRENANDGARFHYIKRDGETKEHIFIMVAVHDNLVLMITFYLPRWREDQDRLNAVHSIMNSFHFLDNIKSNKEPLPPLPPLK